MRSLHVTLCIASLATLFAACAAEPGQEALLEEEAVAESADALIFQQGDPDITWSGPVAYGALWAQQSFRSHPGLYIFKVQQLVRGAVYLSPETLCQFSSFNETAERVFINTNDCSGPHVGLAVSLNCLKLAGQDLSCTGSLNKPNGQQSGVSGTIRYEVKCDPTTCYDGPLTPYPDPDGDGKCPPGQSPCGPSACCGPGERCGQGQCWVPQEGDDECTIP